MSTRLVDAYDRLLAPVDRVHYAARRAWHKLPPVQRRAQEWHGAERRAFALGRDIERQELGLPPKHSQHFIQPPADLRAV